MKIIQILKNPSGGHLRNKKNTVATTTQITHTDNYQHYEVIGLGEEGIVYGLYYELDKTTGIETKRWEPII